MNSGPLVRFLVYVVLVFSIGAASAALDAGSRLRKGSLDASGAHTCAVRADGKVQCWGWNMHGQLGNGNTTTSSVPVLVKNLTNTIAVTTGNLHTCALVAEGTVRCWGRNDQGQTGLAGSSDAWEPYLVQGLSQVVAIDAGGNHTCAVLVSGNVKCWGDNSFGKLGNGTNTDSGSPVTVASLTRAISVSAGENHTCAVRADGRAKCWGLGTDGRLGQGEFASSSTPVFVSGLVEAVSVSAGSLHTCAATARGRVWCWGYNGFLQLGDGSLNDFRASPVLVKTETGFLGGVIGVATGASHTCALLAGGTATCWGQNYDGQIGNGKPDPLEVRVPLPTPVLAATGKPLTGIAALALGQTHSCVVLASGNARCWGANSTGQLGASQTILELPSATTARAVLDFSVGKKAIALTTGRSHSCALLGTGKVKCWGMNDRGQLGNGQLNSTDPKGIATPGEVADLSGVVALDAGDNLTCALLSNSQVKCWGDDITTPSLITNLTGVVSLAVHSDHSCAALANGGARCWGQDFFGQLGNGPGMPANRFTPVAVSGLGGITSVAVSVLDSCAVSATGKVSCWGQGLPGGGLAVDGDVPGFLTGGATGIALYSGYACAMPGTAFNALGDRKCVGYNDQGNFGNGSSADEALPLARVSTPPNVTYLALAGTHACARVANGTGRCWGNDSSGKLGNGPDPEGAASQQLSPVAVKNLSNATAVEVGDFFSCALTGAGGVQCWGYHEAGRLGNPITSPAQTPVPVLGL